MCHVMRSFIIICLMSARSMPQPHLNTVNILLNCCKIEQYCLLTQEIYKKIRAEKYRCATALYLSSMLAHAYNIIIDRGVGAPGHIREVVDGFNATKLFCFTSSIEGIALEHFSASHHPSPLLESDHVSRHEVIHYYLSDVSKKYAATTSEHSKHIIELLQNRTVLFADTRNIQENTCREISLCNCAIFIINVGTCI